MTLPDKPASEVPIADLCPDIENTETKYIEAVVTLIWPYSSSERAFSLLLAAHDFRLRSSKGQVRANFKGPSAAELAKSHVGIGDSIKLSLRGCKWGQNVQDVATPGKRVGWDLLYGTVLEAEINSGCQSAHKIDVDSQDVSGRGTPDLPNALNGQAMALNTTYGMLSGDLGSWSSPAFLRGKRLSSGPFADIVINPFAEEDGYIPGKGRKRTKFARNSGSWRYMSRTPSPVKDGIDHDSSLGTEDSEILEDDPGISDGSTVNATYHPEVVESALGIPELIQSNQVQEIEDVHVLPEDSIAELSSPRPVDHAPTSLGPSDMRPPPLRFTEQRDASPKRSQRVTTPRLGPLASPGLPLVSPLIKQPGYFAGSYFPTTTFGPSELDASAQLGVNIGEDEKDTELAESETFPRPADMKLDSPYENFDLQPGIGRAETPPSRSPMAKRQNSQSQSETVAPSAPSPDRQTIEASHNAQTHTKESEDFIPLYDFNVSQPQSFNEVASLEDQPHLTHLAEPLLVKPPLELAPSDLNRRNSYAYDGPSGQAGTPIAGMHIDNTKGSPPRNQERPDPSQVSSLDITAALEDADNVTQNEVSTLRRQHNYEGSASHADAPEPSVVVEVKSPTRRRSRDLSSSSEDREERTTSRDATLMSPSGMDEAEDESRIKDLASPKATIVEVGDESSTYGSDHGAQAQDVSDADSVLDDTVESSIEEDEALEELAKDEDEAIYESDTAAIIEEDAINEDAKSTDEHLRHIEATEQEATVNDGVPGLDDDTKEPILPLKASISDLNLITPNNTQEILLTPTLFEDNLAQIPGLITPERSQNRAELQNMVTDEQQPSIRIIQESKPDRRRRTSRNMQRSLVADLAQLSSPWFTPKQPIQKNLVENEQDAVEKLSDETEKDLTSAAPNARDRSPQLSRKASLTKGFRTMHAYFATLSSLSSYFNQTVDIMAVSTSSSTPIKRAPSGPRDHCTTLHLTDASMQDKITTVQIFRPYRTALPSVAKGEVVLLRTFKVQSRKSVMELLSTDGSGWVIFHNTVKGKGKAQANIAAEDVTVSGPPVDYGPEELQRADELAFWWLEEGSDLFPEYQGNVNGGMRVTRSAKKAESVEPFPTSGKDSVQQTEAKGKNKSSDSSVLAPALLHELRDGTKYFDPVPGSSSPVAHELRDGTKWFDVPLGSSESRPESRD